MESSKPQNIKSKDKIGASTINESQHNKKDSLDSFTFILNGTDLTNIKPFVESSTSIIGNNIETKVEENSLGHISSKKEEEKIDEMDSTEPLESCNHDVQKEQIIPVMESTSSVQIEGQFVAPMEEDTFYLDDGHRDTNSDADRIGTLLNKDRVGAFRILSPAKAVDFSIWNLDEKINKDILVVNNTKLSIIC